MPGAAVSLAQEPGVPLAHNKTEDPSACLTFLGIELDTVKASCHLPDSRLEALVYCLHTCIHAWKITLREPQSLDGLLNFACMFVAPGTRWELSCPMIKRKRRQVTKGISTFVQSLGGLVIMHPSIHFNRYALYRGDGIHLSNESKASKPFFHLLGKGESSSRQKA